MSFLNSQFLTAVQHLSNFAIVFCLSLLGDDSIFLFTISFCGTRPVSAWEGSCRKCVYSLCIQFCVWEKHHARVTTFIFLIDTQRHVQLTFPNSLLMCCMGSRELVCYRCYLQACDQRFVIRFLCLPFQSTKAVYRNVKHLLLTIIPLRMFAWCLFICVCAMGWAKKCVQRQRNPVCSGKSKSNSESGTWGNTIKDHV